MNGIAPVDTGYIRSSAQELGNMLKEAVGAQIQEVKDILTVQAQVSSAANAINAAASLNEMGGSLDIIV